MIIFPYIALFSHIFVYLIVNFRSAVAPIHDYRSVANTDTSGNVTRV